MKGKLGESRRKMLELAKEEKATGDMKRAKKKN